MTARPTSPPIPSPSRPRVRLATHRLVVALALLAMPTLLLGAALLPGRALLPADLLVQFEPWRSHVSPLPAAHWDALLWDGIAQYYPWRLFAAESLRAGHVPLWNPYQFCGTPFLANGQSAVLYPLNLLFWLLPVTLAFGWSAWLHLALTGWFIYLFLRRAAGIGRVGAVAGAVVWQGNSFTVAWIHLPTVLCTLTWLPLVLLCCDRALVTGRARCAVAGGTALGLAYLGGHPQMFLFTALLTAAYVLARGLSRAVAQASSSRLPNAVGRLALTGAIIATIGLGLAAVQLLPTLDFLRLAHRAFTPGPESYAFYLKRALQPVQLAGLLLPHPLGNPATGTYVGPENYAEYTLYLGILALVLAGWAIARSRTWHTRFLAAAGLVALLAALGTALNWPLYHWVPGITNTGSPARLIVLYVFAFSLLAGIGVDHLARHAHAFTALLLAGVLGVLYSSVFGVADRFSTEIPGLKVALRPDLIATSAIGVAVIAGSAALTLARRLALLPALITALLALDLLLAGHSHIHAVPRAWVYSEAARPPASEGRIAADAQTWGPGEFPRAVLPPNAATVYHLRDIAGYDSLYFAHYRDFATVLEYGDPSPPFNGNMILSQFSRYYDRRWAQLAGVDRIFSLAPLPELPLRKTDGYYASAPLDGWPRARVVESAVFCKDRLETGHVMARLGLLPDLVVIAGPDQPAAPFPIGVRPTAEVSDPSPNAVTVDLPRGGGGYLLLTDAYAPGWHAYDGKTQLPVRLAYVAFRAVPLPQTAHRVEFRYEPASFRIGLFLSLLTLAGVLAAVSARRIREAAHVP